MSASLKKKSTVNLDLVYELMCRFPLSACRKWLWALLTLHRMTDHPGGCASWVVYLYFSVHDALGRTSLLDSLLTPRPSELCCTDTLFVEFTRSLKHQPWRALCSTRPGWRIAALTTPLSTTCTQWSTVLSLYWAWSPTVPPSLCSASGWRCATRPQCSWLI